ncbi:MAG: hypothetical protein IPO09_14940 [Anaeromyxobacter sp.]|nr:hypothetical protein [Anaeromyxobacter sp.]MBL0277111.1 hypothetical protein [Anaeromyxobacter sp.]
MPHQSHRALGPLPLLHHVLAALALVAAVVPALYLYFGVALLSGGFGPDHGPAAPGLAWQVVGGGLAGVLLMAGYALLLVSAGRALGGLRRWQLVCATAWLSLAFPPFGTLLGVATLLTLRRPEVRRLFGRAATAAWPPAGAPRGGPVGGALGGPGRASAPLAW